MLPCDNPTRVKESLSIKGYKHMFKWSYEHMNGVLPNVVMHTIPFQDNAISFRKRLVPMNPYAQQNRKNAQSWHIVVY